MKKELFNTAWTFLKNGTFATFAEALKAAWSKLKLVKKLKAGVARFQFRKADGTLRDAVGTLNSNNFSYESKGSDKVKPASLVTFWDLDKLAFRSMNIDTFVKFN